MKDFSFYLVTDPHYYGISFKRTGSAYEERSKTDQKCVAETPAITDAGFEQIASDKSTDIVLIPGDLVYRGEYQSHVGFREKLYKLRDSGKKIYLITARHDYAEDPVEFDGDKTIPVKGMEREELRDFYREFGFGGVKSLTVGGREIIAENDSPCITYDSYGADDYNYWFTHYSRDLDKTAHWAFADFGKPNIDKIADKYKQGRFAYKLENLTVSQEYNRFSALAELHIDGYFYENLGAPQVFQIKYTLESGKLTAELLWQNKPANRLPESIMFHVYPRSEKVSFTKLGRRIDPFDIVRNGNRNIAAVENIELDGVKITNLHSPLVGIGKGKILHFDNEYSPLSDGIAYVLYDNIWGTNFPLWYSDNAYFKYDIEF